MVSYSSLSSSQKAALSSKDSPNTKFAPTAPKPSTTTSAPSAPSTPSSSGGGSSQKTTPAPVSIDTATPNYTQQVSDYLSKKAGTYGQVSVPTSVLTKAVNTQTQAGAANVVAGYIASGKGNYGPSATAGVTTYLTQQGYSPQQSAEILASNFQQVSTKKDVGYTQGAFEAAGYGQAAQAGTIKAQNVLQAFEQQRAQKLAAQERQERVDTRFRKEGDKYYYNNQVVPRSQLPGDVVRKLDTEYVTQLQAQAQTVPQEKSFGQRYIELATGPLVPSAYGDAGTTTTTETFTQTVPFAEVSYAPTGGGQFATTTVQPSRALTTVELERERQVSDILGAVSSATPPGTYKISLEAGAEPVTYTVSTPEYKGFGKLLQPITTKKETTPSVISTQFEPGTGKGKPSYILSSLTPEESSKKEFSSEAVRIANIEREKRFATGTATVADYTYSGSSALGDFITGVSEKSVKGTFAGITTAGLLLTDERARKLGVGETYKLSRQTVEEQLQKPTTTSAAVFKAVPEGLGDIGRIPANLLSTKERVVGGLETGGVLGAGGEVLSTIFDVAVVKTAIGTPAKSLIGAGAESLAKTETFSFLKPVLKGAAKKEAKAILEKTAAKETATIGQKIVGRTTGEKVERGLVVLGVGSAGASYALSEDKPKAVEDITREFVKYGGGFAAAGKFSSAVETRLSAPSSKSTFRQISGPKIKEEQISVVKEVPSGKGIEQRPGISEIPKREFAYQDVLGRAQRISVEGTGRFSISPEGQILAEGSTQFARSRIVEGIRVPTLTGAGRISTTGTIKEVVPERSFIDIGIQEIKSTQSSISQYGPGTTIYDISTFSRTGIRPEGGKISSKEYYGKGQVFKEVLFREGPTQELPILRELSKIRSEIEIASVKGKKALPKSYQEYGPSLLTSREVFYPPEAPSKLRAEARVDREQLGKLTYDVSKNKGIFEARTTKQILTEIKPETVPQRISRKTTQLITEPLLRRTGVSKIGLVETTGRPQSLIPETGFSRPQTQEPRLFEFTQRTRPKQRQIVEQPKPIERGGIDIKPIEQTKVSTTEKTRVITDTFSSIAEQQAKLFTEAPFRTRFRTGFGVGAAGLVSGVTGLSSTSQFTRVTPSTTQLTRTTPGTTSLTRTQTGLGTTTTSLTRTTTTTVPGIDVPFVPPSTGLPPFLPFLPGARFGPGGPGTPGTKTKRTYGYTASLEASVRQQRKKGGTQALAGGFFTGQEQRYLTL